MFLIKTILKFINQSYGVSVGDMLLQQVGAYLENNYSTYTVFHYGADQFCIVIDKDVSRANDIASDIYKRFFHLWVLEKIEITLARLYDEKLGWISPDTFISIAEKKGLINELGEIVLHNVCNFIASNNISKLGIDYIEINVSSLQLMQKGFADKVMDVMGQYNIDSSQINIEITETAMMTSFSAVSDNLAKLVENNIAISLDDYGSGYSNISYINKMPFKFIKIDKDIIQASFKEQKARITLEHTIKMLNALELAIIAEGVETLEMKEELVKYGCQYMQGGIILKLCLKKSLSN